MTIDITGLVALDGPVLCFDTCSVLDILRDPTRETVRESEQRAALELVKAIEARTLFGIFAHQLKIEFDAHIEGVKAEAEQALQRLRDQLARLDALSSVFGPGGRTDFRHLDDYVTRAGAVVDRLMTTAIAIPATPEITSKAFLRVNQAKTPARKGKESMKDCVIIESYLDVISTLRNFGLTSRVVFVSSNTRDYTGQTNRSLNVDLAQEFGALRIEYAANLAAAKHYLRP